MARNSSSTVTRSFPSASNAGHTVALLVAKRMLVPATSSLTATVPSPSQSPGQCAVPGVGVGVGVGVAAVVFVRISEYTGDGS